MNNYLVAPYQIDGFNPVTMTQAKGLVKSWLVLSLDIETTGNFSSLFEQDIIMLQLSNGQDTIVVDARFNDLKSILSLIKDRLIIGHNVKYDAQIIKIKTGVSLYNLWDTMVAAQVLECGLDSPKGHFTLESCSRRYVNPYLYTLQGNLFMSTITKEIRKTFISAGDTPFIKEQVEYGALDAFVTYKLYERLKDLLTKEDLLTLVEEVENPFTAVLVDMEIAGVPIDEEMWLANEVPALKRYNLLEEELNELAGKVINWNSPKQVAPVMKSLGVNLTKLDKKTSTVKESVDKLTLEKQAHIHPVVEKYLAYSKAEKLVTSYGEKFLANVDRNTGRIHSSFMQIMDTGRTSSSGPNMQNIESSYDYRKCFRTTNSERTLVIADYSNQEARILADFANEPKMIEIFKENKDLHLETAKLLYKNDSLTKASKERKNAKSVNFLMSYGGGASKLANTFNVPISDAKRTLQTYFETFPALKAFFERIGLEAKNKGFIKHNSVYPRKSYIGFYNEFITLYKHISRFRSYNWDVNPLVLEKYGYYNSKIQRHAQNYRIQGSAATMSKLACVKIHRALRKAGLDATLILMIHDEVVVECRKEDALLVKFIVENSMLEASKKLLTHISIPADAIIREDWFKD